MGNHLTLSKSECSWIASRAIHDSLETKPDTIQSSFRKCGLFPLSLSALLEQLPVEEQPILAKDVGAEAVAAPPATPERETADPTEDSPIQVPAGHPVLLLDPRTTTEDKALAIRQVINTGELIDKAAVVAAAAELVCDLADNAYVKPRQEVFAESVKAKKVQDAVKKRQFTKGGILRFEDAEKEFNAAAEEERRKAELAMMRLEHRLSTLENKSFASSVAKEEKKRVREEKEAKKRRRLAKSPVVPEAAPSDLAEPTNPYRRVFKSRKHSDGK